VEKPYNSFVIGTTAAMATKSEIRGSIYLALFGVNHKSRLLQLFVFSPTYLAVSGLPQKKAAKPRFHSKR